MVLEEYVRISEGIQTRFPDEEQYGEERNLTYRVGQDSQGKWYLLPGYKEPNSNQEYPRSQLTEATEIQAKRIETYQKTIHELYESIV